MTAAVVSGASAAVGGSREALRRRRSLVKENRSCDFCVEIEEQMRRPFLYFGAGIFTLERNLIVIPCK
jgi:hypothetical protein